MKLQLTPGKFLEIVKKSYSLDIIYLLKLIDDETDIKELLEDSAKMSVIHQSLIRKGLITDDASKLTTIGKDLIKFIESEDDVKFVKKKSSVDEFENWWKAFPGTDTFTYKNKKFTGSRSLRQNKEDCKTKFNKILIEGEYTSNQLISSLNYDVEQKKEASIKQGTNKLTYMQNSLTYLNQRSYEPFIELINEGIELDSTPQSGTDI
jgi:hypothetical protein